MNEVVEMKKSTKKAAKSKSSTKRTPKKQSAQGKSQEATMGLKKRYLKKSPVCKVTFRLPKDAAPVADMVTIVGDFNNWALTETQMKKMKNGDFKATLDLPCDREYRFRYLIDSSQWENDWCADKYIPNEHGSDDSVVITINNGG
jgi:1,4-alpha-glucan branching enzyme